MPTTHLLQWIELSRSALNQNLNALTKLSRGRLIAPSVKADAYGHGLPEIIALLLERKDIPYVSVHSLEEAIVCRQAGWDRKIMVLGPLPMAEAEAAIDYDLEPVVTSKEMVARLGKLADKHRTKILAHLKLETGTNRQGVTEKELPGIITLFKKHRGLVLQGASTHFANIEDTTSHEYAQYQLDNFNRLVTLLRKAGLKPRYRHTASSAALLLFEKTRFDLVRPGLAMYGHWPSKETYLSYRLQGKANNILKPVLAWKTRVTQIKQVPADSFVGYGCSYRTTAPTRLAILPVGYYDGYDRGLSNQAHLLIRGKRAPVRGRICMNLMMADITDIAGVKLEEPAVLLGNSGREKLTAEQLGSWAGTINYEILARLSPAIPRIILR